VAGGRVFPVTVTDARLSPDDLRRVLVPAGPELAAVLAAAAVDALRLAPVDGPAPVGGSRYGGVPDLPDDVPWPRWTDPQGRDRPLSFFAQVDVADAQEPSLQLGLPPAGVLMFFCDFSFDGIEGIFGYDREDAGGFRVLHVAEPAARSEVPEGVVTDTPHALAPILVTTVPDPLALEVHGLDVDRDVITRWYAAAEQLDAETARRAEPLRPLVRHQLGGHSRAVQGSPEAECAHASGAGRAEDRRWRLLLQLDTCPSLGTDWGGGGTLYWTAPHEALGRRDYDRGWFVMQC
jgi:uncharacterized protein YwqG